MKKRIFSMLLMGAMVIASMSMFTSCKDYDDDINANKAEIASLKAALQEQKTSLEAAIAAAKSEAQTANATLNTKLTELQTLVGNNKTDLENAIKAAVTDSKAYADGIGADALKAAKEYADAAAKEAAATAKAEALEAAGKDLADLKALMEAGDAAAAAKASELAAKIDAVDESVNKLIAAEKEERVNALLAVNTQIENIKLQIAALEKFQATITKEVADIAKDLESTKKILEGVQATAEQNKKDIAANKEAIAKNVTAIADLNSALAIVDGKVAGLEDQVVLLKKADAELGTKIADLDEKLSALIAKNATDIAAIDAAYKAADAALKSEFQNLLKGYYTKTEVNDLIKNFITSEALAPYAKTAEVTAAIDAALATQKAAMEEQITATLNAYDAKLAAALTALFTTNAEGAAAADVTMSEEAIKALEELKKNFNNGINKQVEAELNVLKVAQGKQLTSLVFRPDLYLDGIEAVEVIAINDTVLALLDETKRAQVTELWGVKGKNYVAVPDSALTTWYYNIPEGHGEEDGPAYIIHDWFTANASGIAADAIFGDDKAGEVQRYKYYPLATADFHVNPTTANLDGAVLNFYSNYPKVEDALRNTRVGNDGLATPVPSVIEKTSDWVENGILTVPFEVNREMLNAARYNTDRNGDRYYNDHEAFIALQATVKDEAGNDTTVTSDYALLTPSDIDIVALGGKWMHGSGESHYISDDHLWTKLVADNKEVPITSGFVLYQAGVKNNVPFYSPIDEFKVADTDFTLKIPYNSTGEDLNKLVTTHVRYGFINADGEFEPASEDGAWDCDKELTADDLAKYGLHYEFEAIHYLSGSNMTDEFKHIKLTGEKNCIATPTTVDDKGVQQLDKPAGRETIGRMPIVRANLVSEDGEVLAIGYILIEIIDQNIDVQDVVIELPKSYMNCTAPAAITWAQVEDQILKKIQLSKTEFEALYELETMPLATSGTSAETWYNTYGGKDGLAGRFYSEAEYSAATGFWGDVINYEADQTNKNYPTAGHVSKTAVQYIKKDGKWQSIYDLNAGLMKTSPKGAAYNLLTNTDLSPDERAAAAWAKLYRPLGAVYEHVNAEGQQTTVLEWNVGSEVPFNVAGTAADASYTELIKNRTDASAAYNQKMETSIAEAMKASGASAESEGQSTRDIEVTVAFKQKDANRQFISTNAIYVTLRIKAGDLYFAYAKISGKDLSLWYQENSYKNAALKDETDAAEVHLNVPTPSKLGFSASIEPVWNGPAAKGDVPLHGDLFYKQLNQTFREGLVGTAGLDEHFSKFTNAAFKYRFVNPETAGAKYVTVSKQKLTGKDDSESSEFENSWVVNGVSGAKYLLQIKQGTTRDAISAVAWINPNGIAENLGSLGATVCQLVHKDNVTTGALNVRTTSISYANNAYAQDILNYAGRFNQDDTDLQMAQGEYLSREDKTFTAYISLEPNTACYNLLMPNSYFRARFLRPINVFGKTVIKKDAINKIEEIKVTELVGVKDWRKYAVTNAETNESSNVHSCYYEINDSTFKHFFVDFANIRTDHDLAATGTVRALDPTKVTEIEALTKVSSLPSLTTEPNYFKLSENGDKILYKNNDANVGTFHFYVPVYVCYAFGDYWWNAETSKFGKIHTDRTDARTGFANEPIETQKFTLEDLHGKTWANIAPWKPVFTLKTYAIITISQTDNSNTDQSATPAAGIRRK